MIQAALYGRIGSDPQARTTSNGNAMTTASFVADATAHNAEEPASLWFNVIAFGRAAEDLARCRKGDMASLSGKVTLSVWTDANGAEQKRLQLTADSVVSARTVRPGRRLRAA